jgi:hypothetical protein
MSVNVETLLYEEIETEFDKLSTMEPGSEKYKATVDGLSKLMDRAIEIERLDADCREKTVTRESEQEMKLQQMKDDKRDRLIKNIIGVAGIILPLAVTIWGTKVSLKFEEEGTITTNMGRGFIQRLFPKK